MSLTSADAHLLSLLVYLRDCPPPTREDTRQAITGEAMILFTHLGYGGTSMRGIASAVGIQAASLYAHFPQGKQQILYEGLIDICNEFLAEVSAPLTPAMSAIEQFDTLIRRHVTWQLSSGAKGLAWHAAFGGLGVEGALSEEQRRHIKTVRRLYYDYHRALSAELCDPANARATSQAVLTLCDNAHRMRPTPETNSEEVADLISGIARRIAAANDLPALSTMATPVC